MITFNVRRATAVLAATTGLLLPCTGVASAESATLHRAAGDTVTTTLYEAIAALPVADESRDGYVRTAFKHWTDADKDGCNPQRGPDRGSHRSPRGHRGLHTRRRQLVLPLRQHGRHQPHRPRRRPRRPPRRSLGLGASTWSAKERELYANDLDEPRALIAVTARSNRSKADQDVAQWLPPATDYQGPYLTHWAVVKTRWGLTTDPAEKNALTDLSAGCTNEPITLTLAR